MPIAAPRTKLELKFSSTLGAVSYISQIPDYPVDDSNDIMQVMLTAVVIM